MIHDVAWYLFPSDCLANLTTTAEGGNTSMIMCRRYTLGIISSVHTFLASDTSVVYANWI